MEKKRVFCCLIWPSRLKWLSPHQRPEGVAREGKKHRRNTKSIKVCCVRTIRSRSFHISPFFFLFSRQPTSITLVLRVCVCVSVCVKTKRGRERKKNDKANKRAKGSDSSFSTDVSSLSWAPGLDPGVLSSLLVGFSRISPIKGSKVRFFCRRLIIIIFFLSLSFSFLSCSSSSSFFIHRWPSLWNRGRRSLALADLEALGRHWLFARMEMLSKPQKNQRPDDESISFLFEKMSTWLSQRQRCLVNFASSSFPSCCSSDSLTVQDERNGRSIPSVS